FQKKEISVVFNHQALPLKGVAEILSRVGYEPHLSMQHLGKAAPPSYGKRRMYQLGVAGFCFANIMLLSFPAYFGITHANDAAGLRHLFSTAVLILSQPVFFFCAQAFFRSGFTSLKKGVVNIDAPIALAILITFCRSVYELLSATGEGYMDSMAGIVFFMLIGRALQDRTTDSLSFERDYTSYFPIAVGKLEGGKETPVALSALLPHDRIVIHHNEIIPADGLLVAGTAAIDYSFVTGETLPEHKQTGDMVYAGGRQTKGAIELVVVKAVAQSYLTNLWQNDAMRGEKAKDDSYIHLLSRWFTVVLFAIATAAGLYWWMHDATKLWPAVTAVLIVACPCSLLLSSSFTNGHIIRFFDRQQFFVRNSAVVERLAKIKTIVFDKTGTLTQSGEMQVGYEGPTLQYAQKMALASLAAQSNHPLSKALQQHLNTETLAVEGFEETVGKGCSGTVNGQYVMLGSTAFVGGYRANGQTQTTNVAFNLGSGLQGQFTFSNVVRPGIAKLLKTLQRQFSTHLISGDHATGGAVLQPIFGASNMLFQQSPEDKLHEIVRLKASGGGVLMVGDGLNDAGALKLADVGIAITEKVNNFCPASDAILAADRLPRLASYIKMAKVSKAIVVASFVLSILYNFVGLWFAVKGDLEPLIAAILMPASSISIVLFTAVSAKIAGKLLVRTEG
ncbi:MAG: HAD family hydrolase, partial [Bacteroidetes bacterium]